MPSERDLSYILDIVQSARVIQDYVDNIDRAAFDNDVMRQDAVIRRIELLGEATKHLSDEFKNTYPSIPWKNIAGMRDVIIHDYRDIVLERVWFTATIAVSALIEQLESLIPPESPE